MLDGWDIVLGPTKGYQGLTMGYGMSLVGSYQSTNSERFTLQIAHTTPVYTQQHNNLVFVTYSCSFSVGQTSSWGAEGYLFWAFGS